jgi:hypothetical protein
MDARYLEPSAKVLHRLFHLGKKNTVLQAASRQLNWIGRRETPEIQVAEYDFSPAPTSGSLLQAGIMQLWLHALRHFTKPQGTNKEAGGFEIEQGRSMRAIAALAHRLRFSSDHILKMMSLQTERLAAENMFRAICRQQFYAVDTGRIRELSRTYEKSVQHLARVKDNTARQVRLTTDCEEEKAGHRFNSPLWRDHLHDRASLFIHQVYSPDQPPSTFPTSFAVTRDIIFSFFGKEPLYSLFAAQQSGGSPVEEPKTNSPPIAETPEEESMEPNNEDPNGEDSEEVVVSRLSPSDSLDLQPHPPGTPDRMAGVEDDVPFAPGFEEHISKAPLNTKAEISIHRRATEIIRMWYNSEVGNVVVFFLFESRSYYKFPPVGGTELKSTLEELSKDHYFLVYNGSEVASMGLDTIYEAALQHRLVLVGKKDNPRRDVQDDIGTISSDVLQEYITKYDVKTGKRKEDLPEKRSAKRQLRSK